ncbi:MAG: CPBP family glutamic-type intramembrane protease, partial [Exilispira sp.]|nr:CPBP family glutamic-type intramembrane protease [Exilispira sp.]
VEEYYFRYILELRYLKYVELSEKDIYIREYKKSKNNDWGLFSFIFALIHLNPITFIFNYLISYYLYYIKDKTKSFLFVFIFHFFSNLIIFYFTGIIKI